MFGDELFAPPPIPSADKGKGKAVVVDVPAAASSSAAAAASAADSVLAGPIDRYFLKRVLTEIVAPKLGSISAEDLAMALFDLLRSARQTQDIQSDLFDMLGFDCFEVVEMLLEKRAVACPPLFFFSCIYFFH